MNDVIPYWRDRGLLTSVRNLENHLPLLRETQLEMLVPVLNRALQLEETETRISACRDVVAHHADLASSWLQNRYPGERNIRIDSMVESREYGRFGKGERLRATTQISIW